MTKIDEENKDSFKQLDDLDFSAIIAVAIHDMKNSLSLLLQSIDSAASSVEDGNEEAHQNINSVRYEANRMNTTLVQILSLYRADANALPLNVDECFVSDLFEEVVGSNESYIKKQNINIDVNIDNDLSWFLDRDLVYLLINDVLINAVRYGCNNIELNAQIITEHEVQKLKLVVKDDGSGYPQSMLEMSEIQLNHFCISEGRTGLGLFFARLIANAHKNKAHHGHIKLSNDPNNGGSVFELILP